jgi:hypothetical protein
MEDLDKDGIIILKLMLTKEFRKIFNGSIWLKRGARGELL